MDGEQQLFEGSVEAVIIGATWVPGEGWQLRLQVRRQFQDWQDARTELYDHLSTPELVDVLDASLGAVRLELGL